MGGLDVKKKKVFKGVICSVIVLLLLVVGGGVFAAKYYYSKLTTTEKLNHEEVAVNDSLTAKEEETEVINIAILGIDQDGDGSNGRSDATKVLSLDMKNKKVKLSSFQRDTMIFIPDGENGFDKLNHAYWYGEAPLTLKTLNYNFDLDITRYVAFNFDAIEKVIDAMGGVEIDVRPEEKKVTNDYIRSMNRASDDDVDAPELTESGLQLLSGRQAMGYMRNRYAEGGDFGRMERQSKVMEAVIAKVSDQSYLELIKLAEECLPYVETNLTMKEIIDYGTAALGFDLKNIEQIQVPHPDSGAKSVEYKGYSPFYIMRSYQDLVKEVHAFIYNDPNYQPSQTVIETESAIYDQFGTVE